MKQILKSIMLDIPLLKMFYIQYCEKKGTMVKFVNLNLDMANKVLLDKPLCRSIRVGLVKDDKSVHDEYISNRAYYPKYERFLKNNHIQYDYYDIESDNWKKTLNNSIQ